MEIAKVPPDFVTKSLLIMLHKKNKDVGAAIGIVDAEPDDTVTPHMFSNAIAACGSDWRTAIRQLNIFIISQYQFVFPKAYSIGNTGCIIHFRNQTACLPS